MFQGVRADICVFLKQLGGNRLNVTLPIPPFCALRNDATIVLPAFLTEKSGIGCQDIPIPPGVKRFDLNGQGFALLPIGLSGSNAFALSYRR